MRKITVVCLLLPLLGLTAQAAPLPSQSWQLIDRRDNERMSLDKARITRLSNGNTAAWSRLSLGFDIPDSLSGARYNTIEALNSYDCNKREYRTLKRIYVSPGGQTVREEKVEQVRIVSINEGSFEEKLLPHVCKPRAVGEMKEVATQLEQLMAPAKTPKAPPQAAAAPTHTVQPAQNDAEVLTVAANDARSKPRMIELPPIDLSKVDNPPTRPISPPSPKLAPAKPRLTEAGEDKTTPEKAGVTTKASPSKNSPAAAAPATDVAANKQKTADTAKPNTTSQAKPVETPSYHTGNVSRAEIERQLATFGPRKARARSPSAKGSSSPALKAVAPEHWSYEGAGGPDHWARLHPDNSTCANGQRQSPIDIRDGIKVDLEPIQFKYAPASYSVIDTGHTVQVNIGEGHGLRIMGRDYQLLQFHFHKPSEESINGVTYPMVAHFVHKAGDGSLAVVAVLLSPGEEHPAIQAIWNNLPLDRGLLTRPTAPLDLPKLIPEKGDYWTYMGSLTTPPCSEDVLWMVMKQPLSISPTQLAIFARLYPHNARPVQPTHNRLIKESR